MAKFKDNVVTHGLSGKVGNMLQFSQRAGKTIVGRIPNRSGIIPTDKQEQVIEKFQEGAVYARTAMADPAIKALYEAGTPEGQSPYNVALGDYCSAPKIKLVDVTGYKGIIGDIITVKAIDNFMVKTVKVRIEKLDGTLIEAGDAVQDAMNGNKWNYTATVANAQISGIKVIAEARDLPGNITTKEELMP